MASTKDLARLAEKINKRFEKEGSATATVADDGLYAVTEWIPCGIDAIDRYVMAATGGPVGRMIEIFGSESSGKTTLGYNWIAVAQRIGDVTCAWIDSEHAFDKKRAAQFGVDSKKLLIVDPRDMESAIDAITEILEWHDPKNGRLLVVWDSIAAATPNDEFEADADEPKIGLVARLLSTNLRKYISVLPGKRGLLVALNQQRVNLSVKFGSNVTTCGGNAVRYYSSIRLQLSPGSAVKNSKEDHVGKDVTVTAMKTRFSEPFRSAKMRLLYDGKFDNDWSTLDLAKSLVDSFDARDADGKAIKGAAAVASARKSLGWPEEEI